MAIAPSPLTGKQGFLELLGEPLPVQERALELYQRLLAISDLAAAMNAASEIDQIQYALAACFRDWIPQHCVTLCVLDGNSYRRCRVSGTPDLVKEGVFAAGEGLTGKALSSGTALWVKENVSRTDITGWTGPEHPGSAVIQPLIALGRVVGALELISCHPSRFDQVEYHLSFLVAAHLSSSLNNVLTRQELASANARLRDRDLMLRQLSQELELLAHTDDLTGLYNKRRLFEQLNAEIARAKRYGEIMSCLMIDIDHFKLINDSFGHQAGDEVLRQVGTLLRRSLRVTDFIARYGGEEFTALLPRTDAAGAYRAAENLRKKFGATPFHIPSSSDISLTISIGIASCTKFDRLDSEQVILRADTALYDAKRSGRNRCCFADESGQPKVNILAAQ
jgi:diguanylate cyclase (GGDEF)-like protein